jgi:hypothetical protein
MVNAVSNSVVPKSLLLWEILWCWKLCDVESIRPNLRLSAELAVMGGTQAAKYWRKLKLLH